MGGAISPEQVVQLAPESLEHFAPEYHPTTPPFLVAQYHRNEWHNLERFIQAD
jgi:hypothetical protein